MTVTSQHRQHGLERFAPWSRSGRASLLWARAAAVAILLAAVVAPHSRAGELVRLKGGAVDLLQRAEAASLRATASAPRAGRLWIVQASGRVHATLASAIAAVGGEIMGYLPDDAYLVRADASRVVDLGALAGVRAVAAYEAGDKLAPSLMAVVAQPLPRNSTVVRAFGLRGTDCEAIAASAQAVAGVVALSVDTTVTSRPVVTLDVPGFALAALVAALAADDRVEFLEDAPEAVPLNRTAAAILQSGNITDRTLFTNHGLTGVGQTVGLADMGIDHDACQFRFGAGPGTLWNSTQPPSVNVTNPGDKVTTYYLLDGAEAYDSALTLYHGSRVAGAIAGDDYAAPATRAPRSGDLRLLAPDAGDGMAPGAQIVVQDLGTAGGTFVAGFNQEALLRQSYGSGARVHNASYGEVPYDQGSGLPTVYSGSSGAIDETLWAVRDLTAVFAAGNWGEVDPATCFPGPCQAWSGARSLAGLGAVAKNTITVGASGNPGASEMIGDLDRESSRGPTLEGLWKPDVVAPGHNLSVQGDDTANPPCREAATPAGFGTSLAAGTISGMAALVRQYFTDGYYPSGMRTRLDPACEDGVCDPVVFNPSNALVKAVLVNSARSLDGARSGDTNLDLCPGPLGCSAPSAGQGWGRVTADDGLYFAGDARDLRVIRDLWNGSSPFDNSGRGDDPIDRGAIQDHEVHSFAFRLLANVNPPLKCTLAWSDPAPSPAAAAVLVNDLDLEIHDPGPNCIVGDGDDLYYHGNQFRDDSPVSVANGPWDSVNPLENVWIGAPCAGIYNLRVRARSIPGNGANKVAALPAVSPTIIDSDRQGYALVCTGDAIEMRTPPSVSAVATPSPAVGCEPLQVDFVENNCMTCVAWEWDFGDGNTMAGRSVSHTYTVPGFYLANVTGRDAEGVEGLLQQPIEVIVGTPATPTAKVGNTLKVVKLPSQPQLLATWQDIGVPAATFYGMYDFDQKAFVSDPDPRINGVLRSTPPQPLHGKSGFLWSPVAPFWLLQVRAASCSGEPGP